ncbi:MAG TPA: MBL fold metallo-hydrolase [Myxococcota bacterium]|jgi:glyoxylase-like metal-dependent hydrolase (beta-lactamase superfamily II)
MARRQEQEAARPEVAEVAPNVLRMQLPIRMPGLGHVNCYAILDAKGAAIVDPGLPGPGTWRAIQDRLRQAGLEVRHVHTVIVTHSHPDHFGGAARFAKEAGAAVVAHRSFSFGPPVAARALPEVSVEDLAAPRAADEPAAEDARRAGAGTAPEAAGEASQRWLGDRTPWGGERPRPPMLTKLKWRVLRWLGSSIVPVITHPVEHGDVLELAGREWFVVHTPGHTSDHFCLHDPEHGTFLAGDHVLPTITPHISGISSSPDPLSSFFYSLDRVAEIAGVRQVLPAHGHPFSDLRARTEAIKRHHHERLEKVKAISKRIGAASVEAFSHELFNPRSWGSMAESETYAHLEHLRIAGQAERHVGGDGKLVYLTD